MCLVFTICLLAASLIIGLPCYLLGCNEFACPLQEYEVGHVVFAVFVADTCSECVAYNYAEACTTWSYTDCSYWSIELRHSLGSCALMLVNKMEIGAEVMVYVREGDQMCTLHTTTIQNLPYVGITFLVLATILMLGLAFYCALAFRHRYKHRYTSVQR
jgi:hypothetical protein